MTPLAIGNLQFTLSLLLYILITVWFLWPKLTDMNWQRAVLPLLLIHAFRYGPMTLLMPGQVDPTMPMDTKETIAYGDLISGILAIIAAVFVRYNLSGGKILTWVFSIAGIIDIILATMTGIAAGSLDKNMGFNLYILNFYVPMLIVSHYLIIRLLLKKKNTAPTIKQSV